MSDFLDGTLAEIRGRLTELRPLVDEYRRLEAAETALAGVDTATTKPGRAPSRQTTARASAGKGNSRRAPRRKGAGSRARQALKLVRQRPGITIRELADAMNCQQNYLYRVMPDLAQQGLVTKSGRGWHPASDAPVAGEQ